MALPTSRNTTYTAGSQVKSADLNALQDTLIALNNLITAAVQSVWSGITLAADQHVTVSGTGRYKHGNVTRTIAPTTGVNTTAGGPTLPGGNAMVYRTGASGGTYIVPIHTTVGERIRSITFSCKAASGGAIATAQLVRQVSGAASNVGSAWASSGSTSYADFTSAALDHTVTAGGIYMLCFSFSGTAANTDFERIDVVADQP